jgi:hypothetical protein
LWVKTKTRVSTWNWRWNDFDDSAGKDFSDVHSASSFIARHAGGRIQAVGDVNRYSVRRVVSAQAAGRACLHVGAEFER